MKKFRNEEMYKVNGTRCTKRLLIQYKMRHSNISPSFLVNQAASRLARVFHEAIQDYKVRRFFLLTINIYFLPFCMGVACNATTGNTVRPGKSVIVVLPFCRDAINRVSIVRVAVVYPELHSGLCTGNSYGVIVF
jgi:hypothetical protein